MCWRPLKIKQLPILLPKLSALAHAADTTLLMAIFAQAACLVCTFCLCAALVVVQQ
jgi:hypothetical protein